MPLILTQKRSAGIPVTGKVHRLIREGDSARDRQDWASAAAAYAAALAANPALGHIWVQYGHVLKEDGKPDAAAAAYDRAFVLRPDDSEPLIHVAYMRKAQGDVRAAAEYFLRAIQVGDGAPESLQDMWIQYGHMLKEDGKTDAAAAAYDEAFGLRPDDPEPLIHAAHMRKAEGNGLAAAEYFLRAIRAGDGDPESLQDMWIQYGHMLKEEGKTDAAAAAYDEAFALQPDDPEPLIQAAHMRKAEGDARAAAKYFVRAIQVGDGDTESLQELSFLIRRITPIDNATLYRAARHVQDVKADPCQTDAIAARAAIDQILAMSEDIAASDKASLRSARILLEHIGLEGAPSQEGGRGMVFDLTDLMGHFRYSRLPTGIQRVQIEVVTRALRDPDLDVRLCCFVNARDALIDIPGTLFLELAAMSTAASSSGTADWRVLQARAIIHQFLADAFVFQRDDTLVNLGTSWWIYNYFLIVRNAKRNLGVRYVPFVHDLIPIMATNHCVTGVVEDYVHWLVGAFDHADFFLVNSESTRRDLICAAERLGHHIDNSMIEVVTLDADFRRPLRHDLPPKSLSRWSLVGKDYCLFVSTIESRKNHILALDAWARLIETHGADAVPMLVCVGRMGWLNAGFHERLARNSHLRSRVLVIEQVSDEELALLYSSCSFTLYPSHYEGWGLPVTESLCYGRVAVVADNSSLPEAGGKFVVFFESNFLDGLVAALERVLFEVGYRARLEQDIAAGFRPRSWSAIARQITDAVARVKRTEASENVPIVVPGRYYPVSLYKGTRLWRGLGSGEMFRAGTGWVWPETFGSRTTAGGGELLLRVTDIREPLRLYLRLRGLDTEETSFLVSAGTQMIVSGNLNGGEERWVVGDITTIGDDGIVSIHVRGGSIETIEMNTGGACQQVSASISVVGFALHKRTDEMGRLAFIENAALGSLSKISAYAEPIHGGASMAA